MKKMQKLGLGLIVAWTLSALGATHAANTPLVIPGKSEDSNLYQRVLTTPDCNLSATKDAVKGEKVKAFTRYYVYERTDGRLQVGTNTKGNKIGWINESCAIDWNIQTALFFTNPANRNPAVIFSDEASLKNVLKSKEPKDAEVLLNQIKMHKQPKNVIATEPEKYVDIHDHFYLLPILESDEAMLPDGNYARLLKIGSITQKDAALSKAVDDNSAIKAYKAALVFVIDSSISMQPYLDQTKQAIMDIYEEIEAAHLENSVQFGLVSFRSSLKATPKLEYTSKMFVNPKEATSVKIFQERLKDLNQATASSIYFNEDAYSGIYDALNNVDWKDYGGRFIVLITDAGAITGRDPHSGTGLDSAQLRMDAADKGVAIYALHLLTPSGKRAGNHEGAKAQYLDLTMNKLVNKSLYYPVPNGDVNAFFDITERMTKNLVNQIKSASRGKLTPGSAEAATDTLATEMEQVGYAMQLAYLGKVQNSKAESFYEGWISDIDLLKHSVPTAEPVVLLTKSQLSQLMDVTSKILQSASESLLDPSQMFDQLVQVAASMGRDPDSIQENTKISDMGLFDEYLEGLPYKSLIQSLDAETWESKGPDEQNQIIEQLENNIRFYQECNDDVDKWVHLSDDDDASEYVYPIPLEALP